MTFRAYMNNIQAKSGKSPQDFWELANKLGFIRNDKIVATHAQLLTWLKSDVGLGHVHANMVILYLRLRTKDPRVSVKMKDWAYSTGYHEVTGNATN
jgi:hypothetical protein